MYFFLNWLDAYVKFFEIHGAWRDITYKSCPNRSNVYVKVFEIHGK